MPNISARTPRRGPVSSLLEMEAALHDLMRKRMGQKYNPRQSYRMCELWNTDRPPKTLKNTPMASKIDALIGFALSEEEIFEAYDMQEMSESALYLYNIMKGELDAKAALEKKKSPKLNKMSSKA